MEWLLSIYLGLALLAVPVTLVITYEAWKRRSTPGLRPFFYMMIVCSVWAISGTLSLFGPSERLASFWQQPVRMGAVILLPLSFLAFSLEYAGQRTWLEPRRFVWFSIVPALSEILNWTPLHPLFIRGFDFVKIGPLFWRQGATPGPWFLVHEAYSYFLVAVSLTLVFVQILRSLHFFRRQAILVFVGMSLGVTSNLIVNFAMPVNDARLPWLDWTQASFTISGLVWSWALLRSRFLDVMPVAHDVVFASMDDAVIVLDNDGRIVDFNPMGSQLIGSPRHAVIGAALGDVAPSLAAAAEQSDSRQQRAEIALNGRVLELRVSPLVRPGAAVVGTLAVLRDITERAEMMKDLGAYARTVSHDLKNPLAAIIGNAYLIETSTTPLSKEAREQLLRISETSHAMGSIINELLLLARVRSADAVKTLPLEMARIVDNARKRLSNQIERSGALISVPPTWPVARGYPAWVEEVWANYLSNALKYGGTPPRAEIGATDESGIVRFWVRDNGAGLSPEVAAQLFQEFSRFDPQRAEGHGLGLSIVARIVKKLGGEVGVDSKPGTGCTFWFTLPAA